MILKAEVMPSHGVLLFKLEAGARSGFTKKACTDVACT